MVGSQGYRTRATHRGHVWTWDFIADATVHGGALRMLTVIDEHTKEVRVLRTERRIGSSDIIRLLEAAIAEHGAPEFIRSDSGPEFIAKELQLWPAEHKIKTLDITPASPWENGLLKASTDASATNASIASNCGHPSRHVSSSKTSATTKTQSVRTVRSAATRHGALLRETL